MYVYRICGRKHAAALDGEGAKKFGGRWNSRNYPALYTSMHLSLAALETLVHVDFDNLPTELVWLKIEIPDDSSIEIFSGYSESVDAAVIGDDWLQKKRTLALVVPSAVIPIEQNVILNPVHIEMTGVRVLETHEFQFDERFFVR